MPHFPHNDIPKTNKALQNGIAVVQSDTADKNYAEETVFMLHLKQTNREKHVEDVFVLGKARANKETVVEQAAKDVFYHKETYIEREAKVADGAVVPTVKPNLCSKDFARDNSTSVVYVKKANLIVRQAERERI